MTLAIYAGSFDPFTNGHHELVARGTHLFDEVVVAVGKHPTKPGLFSVEKRIELIRASTEDIPDLIVEAFDGLLFEYARSLAKRYSTEVVLLRGLRPQGDFASEYLLAMGNRDAAPELETIFLLSSPALQHVSSSLVREFASHGGDISRYVHPAVVDAFEAKRKRKDSPFVKYLDGTGATVLRARTVSRDLFDAIYEDLVREYPTIAVIEVLLRKTKIDIASLSVSGSSRVFWLTNLQTIVAHGGLLELIVAAHQDTQ